ncbi:MAG: class I SAM-dependent methyltransferase [Balneolaceae bacterium]
MDNPDFDEIKKNCNGMLSGHIYRALYETAISVRSGTLAVEVGAGHAPGTISMALGIKQNPVLEKIISFEKIEGGSRENFGSIEKNKEIIKENIEKYGCTEEVEMVFSTPEEDLESIPFDGQPNIGLLFIDADGAIDREFNLLYDRVVEGGSIVIDDYSDHLKYYHTSGSGVHIDSKHKVTKALVDYYTKQGFLKFDKVMGATWFGFKPAGAPKIDRSNPITVYRDLIHMDTDLHNTKSWGKKAVRMKTTLLKTIRKKFPGPYNALLDIKHRLEGKSKG